MSQWSNHRIRFPVLQSPASAHCGAEFGTSSLANEPLEEGAKGAYRYSIVDGGHFSSDETLSEAAFWRITALVALKRGFVVVGNLPTADGTAATAKPGSLLFIDKSGNLVGTYSDPTLNLLNGPWDMTVKDDGDRAILFVSTMCPRRKARAVCSLFSSKMPLLFQHIS